MYGKKKVCVTVKMGMFEGIAVSIVLLGGESRAQNVIMKKIKILEMKCLRTTYDVKRVTA